MAKYPIYLELQGRRVVLVGGGPVAFRKAETLVQAGARLVVVAPAFCPALEDLCLQGRAEMIRARYEKAYIGPAVLVIAATDDRAVNERVYGHCQELGILCNAVDQPDLCDFYVPAVVQRGALQIAIGTDGRCPAFAGHVRQRLERLFTEQHGRFLEQLQWARQQAIKRLSDPDLRKAVMGHLVGDASFETLVRDGVETWRARAIEAIAAAHKSS